MPLPPIAMLHFLSPHISFVSPSPSEGETKEMMVQGNKMRAAGDLDEKASVLFYANTRTNSSSNFFAIPSSWMISTFSSFPSLPFFVGL